nr:hypothetical protein GCM10020092_075560 [Actinoplanes digitatis]
MDELDLLATARPATPPTAETTAAARDRLFDLMNAERLAAAAPRRRNRLLGWGLIPAMAAAVALLMVLTVSWGGPGAPPGGDVDIADAGPRPPQRLRNLLLAAADRTSGDGPAVGRYWVSRVESGTLLQVGGAGEPVRDHGPHRGDDLARGPPRRPCRVSPAVGGGAPASDTDRAAWRRAGSPSSWPIDESCPTTSGRYTAGAGATRTVVGKPGASTFLIGGGYLTAAQARDLPADPVRLQAWLVGSLRRGSPNLTAAELSKGVFDSMINLLYQAPGTPAVRAAAYRLLADLPGLRDLGTVTDPKGRPGTAVTLVTNEETPGVRQADTGGAREVRLIFDPESGRPLAWETRVLRPADYLAWVPTGAVFDYEAVLATGWTDDAPPATTRALPEDALEPATC